MKNVLDIKNLNKKYLNSVVLNNLNLTLKENTIVGILGPNGSGKTTLLKIIAGLAKESSGEVLINGLKPSTKTKNMVSYLSDKNFIDNSLKVYQALNLYNDFFDFDMNKAVRLLDEMKINIKSEIASLSKGMKEKVFLILTLSRNAKIFILDEPIAGVDVITRDQILNIIIENVLENSTMLITTHLIKDIERIFDEVAFLKDGKIDKVYKVDELRENSGLTIEELYKEIFKEGDNNA
ncbi:ABC transporter ATP-binding protein [Streptobacillus moniliformis]|uniref:ABC transporter related protein n=1 Tax=Streptobacillus moniliformis (strain ATCC 14647 / DSM 12112 / NCTC 10651 / 9901) TaxID=519441 RepID=D1AX22_STRM9|nr:ABC transporter ATP-binding protein [Streptobacillus moniliformis]ACZ00848.1 ABC transporter related protein [Streptobacillus moniliformis DSM 12112]AVL42761.1 ABC transporter ATP-binding protein [Streptobacillus moniliformis]QXW65596.1 ABC transporter ATP-binding protein [Streptobacillus moniliformis]SQA14017.1 ABC-type transporter ATP-binding protein EcsA [Streptobacillus moniliformis]